MLPSSEDFAQAKLNFSGPNGSLEMKRLSVLPFSPPLRVAPRGIGWTI